MLSLINLLGGKNETNNIHMVMLKQLKNQIKQKKIKNLGTLIETKESF